MIKKSSSCASLWGDGGSYELFIKNDEFIYVYEDGSDEYNEKISKIKTHDALLFIKILQKLTSYGWDLELLADTKDYIPNYENYYTSQSCEIIDRVPEKFITDY